jgi:hypothetical protein
MNNSASATLAMGMAMAASSGYQSLPYGSSRWKGGKTGNAGQKEAQKARNRRNNKLARKNRRLNLRRGKIAGK